MADYYPLLARAVAALPNSTRDTRAAIYERARKALLGQLRSLDPPVSEEHLQNESNALDDAIARLEGELAQEPAAAPATPAATPAPVKPAPPPCPVPPPPPVGAAPPPPPSAGVRPPPPPPLGHAKAASSAHASAEAPKIAAPPPPPPELAKPAPPAEQPPDRKIEKTAIPPGREAMKHAPEPETPAVIARAPASRGDARPVAPTRPETGRGVSRQMLIWIPLILLIGGGIAFAAWRWRVPQEEFAKPRASVAEAARPQGSAKINERAGAPGAGPARTPAAPPQVAQTPRPPEQPVSAPAAPAEPPPASQQQATQAQPAPQQPPAAEPTAPVAQRSAILVQAAVNDMQNVDTHVGTTVWRQEESRRPGANGSPAVRADVDIPAVGLKFVVLIEKNNDTTLRASHMMTLRFLPQEGSTLPGIVEIGSPQMRNEGAPSVEPLAGAQAKITDNIYIVALSSDPTLAARNLDTLKTRGWFDFPIRLSDGRISKITVEKGAPGDRLLEQALEQWQR